MKKPDPQLAITDKEFDKLFKEVLKSNDKYFDKKTDSFMPQLLVVTRKTFGGEFERTLVAFAHLDEDRHKVMQGLGIKFYEEGKKDGIRSNPIALFMTTEAWTRKFGKKGIPEGKKVSDYKDKTEILMTAGTTLDKRTKMIAQKIERDSKNNIKLGKTEIPPGGKVETNLLWRFYEGYVMAANTYEKTTKS